MGHPIANVGVTPDIDARRGKLVANAASEDGAGNADGPQLAAASNVHEVGYRGGNASASPATTSGDTTLDLAIQVAEKQPVAQL